MKKIAIISDLHIGVHGDSEKWHKTMLDYASWLVGKLKEEKATSLYILGDVFDNRKAVGVETMQVARDFFNTILFGTEKDLDIVVIVGNHDSFFEDNSDVSSVSLLDFNDRISVVSTKCGVTTKIVDGKSIMLCPWGTDMRALANDHVYMDVVMGHFAISSFADVPGHLYTGGYTPEEITALSPLVFSGHFHLRDDKKFSFGGEDKRIIIVGSPYQLNWSDAGSSKGIYFYTPRTGEVSFIENDVSPKHVQIGVGDKVGKNDVSNNIIRVVANSVEEAKKVQSYISELKDFGAVEIGAKISAVDSALPTEVVSESVDGKFDQHKILVDYVNACDFGDRKTKVMELMERIYNLAVASQKESI